MNLKINKDSAINSTSCICRFCDLKLLKSVYANDVPWIENEKFYALVTQGALVHGWSIIFPKEHILNLSNHYNKSSFYYFVNEVVQQTKNKFGKISVFEHGSIKENSLTSCGTSHAHLHVVPLQFSLEEESINFNDSLKWIKCRLNDLKSIVDGSEYLFVSDNYDGENTYGFVCVLNIETSQFFRKVIANKIGIPEKFDYKKYKMDENSKLTLDKLNNDNHIYQK